ncbi:hypothetical protein FS837_003600 [Tulasnella sp. UAMH 9824]|nr:hypothetical protein FS837_003600 [Tulasnella sp. UAMH 9824]
MELRSLVLWEDRWREDRWHDGPSIPMNWISQLIGTAMQDLSFDMGPLVPPVLLVLPNLEFLENPGIGRSYRAKPSILSGVLSKTPNLKDLALEGEAAQGDPVNTIPALDHLRPVVCHASWLGFLIPGRPIMTAEILCDSRVRVQGLFEILQKGSVPLRDLTLTYPIERGHPTWSPDDLEPVARYLPELEILRLTIEDPKMDGLQKALLYISQLQNLRIVSLNSRTQRSSGLLDDVWQGSKLKQFLGLTKSPVLERVSFARKFEWKLEEPRVWILREGGKMVRSVDSL